MSRSAPVAAHRHGEQHGHVHGAGPEADGRLLTAAGVLILAFMCAEVVAGVVAHSLALISDAAHMLTDAAAIALALVTIKIAARRIHLRPAAHGDPVRSGQRHHAGAACALARLRGGPQAADAAAGDRGP